MDQWELIKNTNGELKIGVLCIGQLMSYLMDSAYQNENFMCIQDVQTI